MQNRYVFIMLGFLGSGKSFVSRWLTQHMHAVHLRTDDLRLAMFGPDRPELYTPEKIALVNNAGRYAMMQILKSGQAHIVQDANHNARKLRLEIAKEVSEAGATPVVVWVRTPLNIAKERTKVREVTEGHVLFEPGIVEKMAKRLEEPGEDEIVITIDGQASASEQQKSFDEQLAAVTQKEAFGGLLM
jgi:predicted kinase